jgi:chemotaxis protein MotB
VRSSSSPSKDSRRAASKVRVAVLAFGLVAGVLGCVREEQHQVALADLQHNRLELWALKDRLWALDRDVKLLSLRVKDKDTRLSDASLVQAELMKRVDEATVLNAELSERLRKAGQSVKDLSGERTDLSRSLADTRIRLEDLAKKQAAAEARLAQFRALVVRFKRLSDDGKARVLYRGGQMLVELQNDLLFDAGKAVVRDGGKGTLIEVAKILKTLEGRKFQVAGHTDNIKLDKAKFSNNWELSTARAVAVTKVFVEQGVEPSSVSAGGFAEFAPTASNDTPEGRMKNRRMEIVLVPTAEEMVSAPGAAELAAEETPKPPPAPTSRVGF